MQARELIEILVDSLDFRKTEIARAIGVCKHTILKWAKGVKPRDSSKIDKLVELIEENGVNIESELNRIAFAKKETKKIKDEDWCNLIRGILFFFKKTRKELGSVLGVQEGELSRKLNKEGKMLPKHKFRLFSFVKEREKSIKELIELGKNVNNSIIVDGCLVNKENSKCRSQIIKNLFITKDDKLFINTSLLFPFKFHGNEIKFIFDQDDLIVFWENKFGEPSPLRLPRFIEINDTFLVGLGIFIAEGTKTERKPKISNSEPIIVQQGIKFFEHIGIDKKKLCGWVQVHERSPCKDKKELKRFWSNVSGLTTDQIKNVWIKPDRSKIKKVPVKEMGTFHLECNLILSRVLIDGLLSNTENIVHSTPNSELPLLKGFIAGEGWSECRRGVIKTVKITQTDKRWRNLALNSLFHLGIEARDNGEDIKICGFKNFQNHPEMKKKLEDGFNLLCQHDNIPFRNKERIMNLLTQTKRPLNSKEISRLLNLKRKNACKHLLGLFKNNKISRIEGSGSLPHQWFTERYDYLAQSRNVFLCPSNSFPFME